MLVAAACGVWYLGHRRLAGRVKGVKGPYDKKTDVRNTGQTQDSGLGKEKEKKKKEKKREKDKQPQQHDPRLAAKAQHDSDARTALEHAGRISGLPALQPSYKSGKAFAHPDHPSRVEEWSDPQVYPMLCYVLCVKSGDPQLQYFFKVIQRLSTRGLGLLLTFCFFLFTYEMHCSNFKKKKKHPLERWNHLIPYTISLLNMLNLKIFLNFSDCTIREDCYEASCLLL